MEKDKRVDTYIAKSGEFAQPILIHLREVVHKACPQAKETIKWRMPNFEYKTKILCAMAAFKNHCNFHIWQRELSHETKGVSDYGKISSLKNLPKDKEIINSLQKAIRLIDEGKTMPRKPQEKKTETKAPDELLQALEKDKIANANFASFSPSKKKDYIEWIVEAKTETTRNKRIATAIEWIAEGKSRNWKYEK